MMMLMMQSKSRLLLFSCLFSCLHSQSLNEVKFRQVIAKMEADVVEFARQVERLYSSRCNEQTLTACSSYDECLSVHDNQVCPSGVNFAVPDCTVDSGECSGLWDFTASTVRLPPGSVTSSKNPTDPAQIESVCFTQALDEEWFVQKRNTDTAFWQDLGAEPQGFYFGSHTGMFRIFPGRSSEVCGVYDPRTRPWYIAASSGPKNVVLVLDTSGSMQGAKLELMKDAAVRVVETLAVGDRFAIVEFNSAATALGAETTVVTATDSNKQRFVQAIRELKASGSTNFFDSFTLAFDILDNSIGLEANVNCNSAVLFLTDGQMTGPAGVTEADVIALVENRINSFTSDTGHPLFLFTYSVSQEDDVHTFPSGLACAVDNGVWSKVTMFDQIVDSLSSYYFLFALGLGTDDNQDFTAWVEPYEFFSSGLLGTTVSVPVYDRSKTPHLFLGVVGGDFLLPALDAALGIEGGGTGSEESIGRVALLSTARCPRIELELCELESFRRRGAAGDEALCTTNCSAADLVAIEAESCPFVSDYPKDLWKNTENEGKSYKERVCCHIGETWADAQCPARGEIPVVKTTEGKSSSGLGGGAIAGIAVGAIAGVALVGVGAVVAMKSLGEGSSGGAGVPQVSYDDIIPLPPPPMAK